VRVDPGEASRYRERSGMQAGAVPTISFCLVDHRVRPTAVAAIRSAQAANPDARVLFHGDEATWDLYGRVLPGVEFRALEPNLARLGTSRLDVAVRKCRALALLENGGWYLDALDTLTFRPLPEVDSFTIGEECWDPRRRCTGVCASPRGGGAVGRWLEAMVRWPDAAWDHWTDQALCNRLLDEGLGPAVTLPTGRLNWPSESGFTGELRLCEDQIAWLEDNAWVVHYYGRGALGVAYKEMDLVQLERARALDGWLPRLVLRWCEDLPRSR